MPGKRNIRSGASPRAPTLRRCGARTSGTAAEKTLKERGSLAGVRSRHAGSRPSRLPGDPRRRAPDLPRCPWARRAAVPGAHSASSRRAAPSPNASPAGPRPKRATTGFAATCTIAPQGRKSRGPERRGRARPSGPGTAEHRRLLRGETTPCRSDLRSALHPHVLTMFMADRLAPGTVAALGPLCFPADGTAGRHREPRRGAAVPNEVRRMRRWSSAPRAARRPPVPSSSPGCRLPGMPPRRNADPARAREA